MVRNNTYAIYQGIECNIGYTNERGYYLLLFKKNMGPHSHKELEEIGFVADKEGDYFKQPITKEEVTEVYGIRTYAIYEGRTYEVENEREAGYLLVYESKSEADEAYFKSSGFDIREMRPRAYCKRVPLNEIEKIYEEKDPSPNYFD